MALPKSIRQWPLTTLREKLVKIGAKVTWHSKYVLFPLAEVAVPRQLFAAILEPIGRLARATGNAWTAGRKPRQNDLRGGTIEYHDRPSHCIRDWEPACRLEGREPFC